MTIEEYIWYLGRSIQENLIPQNLNSFTVYDQYLNQPFTISEAEQFPLEDFADTEHLHRVKNVKQN